MRTLEIINCFINGASHEFNTVHSRPMVDEDLSLAFDDANLFALAFPECDSTQAHAAGHNYVIHGGSSYAPLPVARMQFDTYIAALGYVSDKLEGTSFGLEEIKPESGHGLAYLVTIEVGESWVIYKPKNVTYWIVVQSVDYTIDQEG